MKNKDNFTFYVIGLLAIAIWLFYSANIWWTLNGVEIEKLKTEYPECFPSNPLEASTLCDFFGGLSFWFFFERIIIVITIVGAFVYEQGEQG